MLLKINTFTDKFAENNDKVNVSDNTQTEEVVDESSKKDVMTEDGAVKATNEEKIVCRFCKIATSATGQIL